MPEPADGPPPTNIKRAGINLGAFLLPFLFVWLVFDNMALGLLVGLLFAGGGEAAQRAAKDRKPDNADHTDEPRP